MPPHGPRSRFTVKTKPLKDGNDTSGRSMPQHSATRLAHTKPSDARASPTPKMHAIKLYDDKKQQSLTRAHRYAVTFLKIRSFQTFAT